MLRNDQPHPPLTFVRLCVAQLDEAAKNYRAVLELEAGNVDAHFNLGVVLQVITFPCLVRFCVGSLLPDEAHLGSQCILLQILRIDVLCAHTCLGRWGLIGGAYGLPSSASD